MNLEGTKHEKAVLVIMAYVIGFTSGFIAFGIAGVFSEKHDQVDLTINETMTTDFVPDGYVPPTEQPPSEVTETEPTDEASSVMETDAEVDNTSTEFVSYENGRLYATVGADRYVLSLSSEIVSSENVEGFSTQGIHKKLPVYNVAADHDFVYFCEQQTDTAECTNFIFDVKNNVIQPVSLEGERLITANDVASTARFENDVLVIGDYKSANNTEPWKLAMK